MWLPDHGSCLMPKEPWQPWQKANVLKCIIVPLTPFRTLAAHNRMNFRCTNYLALANLHVHVILQKLGQQFKNVSLKLRHDVQLHNAAKAVEHFNLDRAQAKVAVFWSWQCFVCVCNANLHWQCTEKCGEHRDNLFWNFHNGTFFCPRLELCSVVALMSVMRFSLNHNWSALSVEFFFCLTTTSTIRCMGIGLETWLSTRERVFKVPPVPRLPLLLDR